MSEKIKRKKRGRSPGAFYVSNDDLVRELLIYYNKNKFTDQLSRYILRIAEGVANSPNFINYSYSDDMKGDAIWRMTKAVNDKIATILPESELGKPILDDEGNPTYAILKNGDTIPVVVKQNNIFGYFSRIAWRAFQNRINIEKKYCDTKENLVNDVYSVFEEEYGIIMPSTTEGDEDGDIYDE